MVEAPAPGPSSGNLLIRTARTLISAGTERMLLEFGRAGWINKARQQPDKVRMVLDKVRTDGIMATWEGVQSKLDQPFPLGYCNVGRVVDAGGAGAAFAPGVRVVSNGPHADVVSVPRNLCAAIPDEVSDDQAAFTVLGAIALQGVRLAAPTLGECFAVTGLGLLGLLTVQILRANGCRVLGVDYDGRKLELARSWGAETVDLSRGEDPLRRAEQLTGGRGLDGVILTAATDSSEPVHQAASMCRKRGRIVLVGVTGLELSRADFYKKELSFQVSCSYGPGRYDPEYEDRGHDYPAGFVRWTAQRNFEAVLQLMAEARLEVAPLITHRYAFEKAGQAYDLLESGAEPYLGILLDFPEESIQPTARIVQRTWSLPGESGPALASPGVSFLGAGGYATRTLAPAFLQAKARLQTIASRGGVTAAHAARKFGFASASTDSQAVILDPQADAIVIATRHSSHALLTNLALSAGKHVFVEKPLAVTNEQLDSIGETYQRLADSGRVPVLMVGFNRRFAPQVQKMKSLLMGVTQPKTIVITINAGAIPAEHWTQDPSEGGRIIGEGCHFVDLLRFLAGSPIVSHSVTASPTSGVPADNVTFSLRFQDGSIGTVHYLSSGSKMYPKERVEVFAGGGILQLDNFRQLRGFGWPGFRSMSLWRQDKGQVNAVAAFMAAIRTGGSSPIPFAELLEVSAFALAVARDAGV